MTDEDPDRIRRFLLYLYVQDRTVLRKPTADPDNKDETLLEYIEIYAMADRYGVPLLKRQIEALFEQCLLEEHDPEVLSGDIIDAVYTTTPAQDRGLRDPLIDFLLRFTLQGDLPAEMRPTLTSVDGLAADLLYALSTRLHAPVEVICTDCVHHINIDLAASLFSNTSDPFANNGIQCTDCGNMIPTNIYHFPNRYRITRYRRESRRTWSRLEHDILRAPPGHNHAVERLQWEFTCQTRIGTCS